MYFSIPVVGGKIERVEQPGVLRVWRRYRRWFRQCKMVAGLAWVNYRRWLLLDVQRLAQMKEQRVGIAPRVLADAVYESIRIRLVSGAGVSSVVPKSLLGGVSG